MHVDNDDDAQEPKLKVQKKGKLSLCHPLSHLGNIYLQSAMGKKLFFCICFQTLNVEVLRKPKIQRQSFSSCQVNVNVYEIYSSLK